MSREGGLCFFAIYYFFARLQQLGPLFFEESCSFYSMSHEALDKNLDKHKTVLSFLFLLAFQGVVSFVVTIHSIKHLEADELLKKVVNEGMQLPETVFKSD